MSAVEWIETRMRRWRGREELDSECLDGRTAPGSTDCLGEACGTSRLTEMSPGARGVVSCLEDPGSAEALKLAAMGILPGVPLELRQRFPAHLFRVGEAEFAVDRELARRIRVRVS